MHRLFQLMTLAITLGAAGCASAATLTGDTVRMVAINQGNTVLDTTIIVGNGPDLLGLGNTVFDFDVGAAGDEFELSMSPPGIYGGVLSTIGDSQITLSGLNFSGGERLRDWVFLQVPSEIRIDAELLSPSSLSFSWTEGRFEGGPFFRGKFLTRMEDPKPVPNPIPLPASSLLLMSVIGLAVGLVFRQER